jgi:hypothetical protein
MAWALPAWSASLIVAASEQAAGLIGQEVAVEVAATGVWMLVAAAVGLAGWSAGSSSLLQADNKTASAARVARRRPSMRLFSAK